MPIVGAFVLPHGAITLDPTIRDLSVEPAYKSTTRDECIKLHNAMRETAAALIDTWPELILLTTPHASPSLIKCDYFTFFGNKKAKGTCEWNEKWTEFEAEFDIDIEATNLLVEKLKNLNNDVEKIVIGDVENEAPLRWGEAIPWWFINREAMKRNFSLPKVIAIAFPMNIKADSSIHLKKLLKFGSNLSILMKQESEFALKRIAVVISGDLAHYHSPVPYKFHESCPQFDNQCVKWAKTDLNSETIDSSSNILLGISEIVTLVGSCGYCGLVTLQGLMQNEVVSGARLAANFVYYAAATYYGMMATYFLPRS